MSRPISTTRSTTSITPLNRINKSIVRSNSQAAFPNSVGGASGNKLRLSNQFGMNAGAGMVSNIKQI
jgi:hypothetical protein